MKKALSIVTAFCIFAFPAAAQSDSAAQGGITAQDLAVQRELAEAIRRGDLSRLETLLDGGADPGTVVAGKSLLTRAIQEKNIPAVQLLLDRGADPNGADTQGLTAAHHAAGLYDNADSLSILRLLAAAGARFDVLDGRERTPLQTAAWEGGRGFAFILAWEQEKAPGFSGSFPDRKSYLASRWSGSAFPSVIGALLDTGEPVDGTDSRGRNAAWYAAAVYGDAGPALTGRLMEAGVPFDITDDEGVSPLIRSLNRSDTAVFMMIFRWEETNSPGFAGPAANRGIYLAAAMERLWSSPRRGEELKALLAGGADPAALISGGEKTVYLRTIHRDHVPLLLEKGISVNTQDKDGRTFLMEAVDRRGGEGLVRYLLEAKADPNIRDKEGRTALMEAWESGVVRLLLDYGADPRAADHMGRTALHHNFYREKELLALLIEAGADIEAPDHEGLTPFLYAAGQYGKTWGLRGTPTGMLNLLDLGADPDKKSPENKTALLLYLEDNGLGSALPSMVRRLLDLGADPAEEDLSGNSPLLTALRSKSDYDNVREIRNMLVSSADKEQVSAAKSAVRAERRRDFARDSPGRLAATAPLLILPGYIGLSVWAREGIYREDPGSNWMGTVNASVTGFGAGALLSFFTYMGLSDDDGFGRGLAAVFIVAPVGGLIGGIAMSAIPPVRKAFKENPVLYYLPVAAAGAAFSIAVVRIWLD
ncbi:MAG: ankyrin repeat domain-containing protein [Treponema sp.]|jgi:ankyrin repeat protein|nr:ankyrin repeat domain-containing protein [Treponema sp.]